MLIRTLYSSVPKMAALAAKDLVRTRERVREEILMEDEKSCKKSKVVNQKPCKGVL